MNWSSSLTRRGSLSRRGGSAAEHRHSGGAGGQQPILLTRLNAWPRRCIPTLNWSWSATHFRNLRNGLKNGHYDLIVTLDFDVEEEKRVLFGAGMSQPPAIAIHRNPIPCAQEPELEHGPS